MNFLKSVLGGNCTIDIILDGADKRPTQEVPVSEGKTETLPLFVGNENLSGTVSVKLEKGAKKNGTSWH